MAITIQRYVDITSGVGGAAQVNTRQLIARFLSSNPVIPTSAIVEMTTLQDVADFFGTSSDEYLRAVDYFGYVSKTITSPNKISFSSYQPSGLAPRIYGGRQPATLSQLQAVTSGQFVLSIGGNAYTMTGLNLSTAVSLDAVASVIQTAVRSGPGGSYTTATVNWDASGNRFVLIASGGAQNATISVSNTSSGTQLAPLLAWLDSTATWVDGVLAQEPVDAVLKGTAISNNFGSFAFIPSISLSQIQAVGEWNDAQNVAYLYSVRVSAANASSWSTTLRNISGICLTLESPASAVNEFPELLVMSQLAATDYTRRNSTVNYMFLQDNLTASVSTDADANTYDNLRVNYYGQTQQAGNNIAFYQRGVMMGLATDPLDINTYVNEMWFKDAITVELLNLLLAMPKISANTTGQSLLQASVVGIVEQALFNGTISVGKTLTTTQQAYITQLTGDEDAWRQVQSQGYWFNIVIQPVGLEYHAIYTLIYSKDDAVRKVTGSNILI